MDSGLGNAAIGLPYAYGDARALAAIRLLLLTVSFLFLLQFGFSLLIDDRQLYRAVLGFGVLGVLGMIAGLVVVYSSEPEAAGAVERLSRLVVGLPGAVLAALGLLRIAGRCSRLMLEGCRNDARWAAGAMAIYGLLTGGIFYRPGSPLPGSGGRPNVFEILGLPIQFYRMLAAVALTVACLRFLSRFRVEQEKNEGDENQETIPVQLMRSATRH
ncbi:MAG: hypothetical protein M1274_02055 [Actinobacteria bacterium]|nr:hypothetical protein [Actinomycetota bacterium]